MLRSFLSMLLVVICSSVALAKDIRYPNLHGIGKSTIGCAVLKLALSKVGEDYKLVIDDRPVTPSRAMFMVESEQLDVYDSGYIPELEQRFDPVYLPVDMGLLGWRVFIVHQETVNRLNQVHDIEGLRAFSLGQGLGWGDIRILEHAGLKVTTATKLENLFRMLQRRRFDLLPLGANEAYRFLELFGKSDDNLVIDQSIALIYPFGRFFYVKKNNSELKQAIEAGMQRALADGSLLALLKSHPFSRDAFERANTGSRLQIRIENPNLTAKFKSIDPKWWYTP